MDHGRSIRCGEMVRGVGAEGDLVEGYKAPSALIFIGFELTDRFQNLLTISWFNYLSFLVRHRLKCQRVFDFEMVNTVLPSVSGVSFRPQF